LNNWISYQRKLASALSELTDLKHELQNIANNIEMALNKEVGKVENKYRLVTIISRVIYILGFGIGLAAQVAGLKVGGAESARD
jgi:hypothetical protein